MKCDKCNHTLAEDAKFCNECGAKVKEQREYCENCNHELTKDDKFCEKCGKKVHNEIDVEEVKNEATQKTAEVQVAKKKGGKGLIALIIGVVVIVVAVLAVINVRDKGNEPKDYSVEGLAEHYGIEEDLLTYEEMSDAVNLIEREYEEDLKGLDNFDRSIFIASIIEEEYGSKNSYAYNTGFIIDEGMSESDKQQVIAALSENKTYKKIVNPIEGAYQLEKINEPVKQKDLIYNFIGEGITSNLMIGDTDGFYTFGNVSYGYPALLKVSHKDDLGIDVKTFDGEDYVAYIGISGLLPEDITLEDAVEEKFKQFDLEINGRKYEEYFTDELLEEGKEYFEGEYIEDNNYFGRGLLPKNTFGHFDIAVAIPVKEVFEQETGTGEEIVEKFKNEELGNGKVNLGGKEIELTPVEDEFINPDVIGKLENN